MSKEELKKFESGGLKASKNKDDWSLVYPPMLNGLLEVLMHGAAKYSPDNWKKVPEKEYKSALMRHGLSILSGEDYDKDSGLAHVDHVVANTMFLKYFLDQRGGDFL